ncbi:hypothetical protein QBC35DRAFT_498440 [Podospora australis]|uniref:Uncharacterized protein n=1 Tax=Podospora australis TaxID=1536484 RepID=A0AAN7AGA0_9PEZI|nr:hypothetical protein QBC35DRAFT_498440 [Podospora australis]
MMMVPQSSASTRRIMIPSLSSVLVWVLTLFVGLSVQQRPNGASVCDYYAQQKYGANTSDTQRELVRRIVTLAFEGGSKLSNVSDGLTGILRPGKFNDVDINLLPYFNGSRASTNVNNAPIGINWLDQGGTEPLAAYIAGEVEELSLSNSSNQYHLFGNFFVAFSRAFGCTLPFPPLPNSSGPVSLAYAHKFMNLDYNQLGYFINQLSLSSIYHGFSVQDADTFKTRLNSIYNVRCAPAISFNPSSPPQLLSLCQNPTCPLAAPVSDCDAYQNLTANGLQNSKPTTIHATATATVTNSLLPSSTTTAPATDPGTSNNNSSNTLSAGAIAGVAVGGAAVLVLAVAVLLFFFRKRRNGRNTPPPSSHHPEQNNHHYSTPTLNNAGMLNPNSPYSNKDGNHFSYYSQDGTHANSSRIGSPQMSEQFHNHGSWGPGGGYQQNQQRPVEIGVGSGEHPPVEMDVPSSRPSPAPPGTAGTSTTGGGSGSSPAPALATVHEQHHQHHQQQGHYDQQQNYQPQGQHQQEYGHQQRLQHYGQEQQQQWGDQYNAYQSR